MGKLSIGSTDILKASIGGTDIKKISIGDTLIWSGGQQFTDDFNRANGSLGSNWLVNSGTPAQIANNAAQAFTTSTTSTPVSWGICNAMQFASADAQYIEVICVTPASSGVSSLASFLILSNPGTPGTGMSMGLMFYNNSSGIAIYSLSGQSATLRQGYSGTPTLGTGTKVAFSCVNGVYTGYVNDVQVGTPFTDSGNIVPRDASHRYGGFLLQGNKPSFSAETFSMNIDTVTLKDL